MATALIHLPRTHQRLIRIMAGRPNEVISHQELRDALWPERPLPRARIHLRQLTMQIREEYAAHGRTPLMTRPGHGYVWTG